MGFSSPWCARRFLLASFMTYRSFRWGRSPMARICVPERSSKWRKLIEGPNQVAIPIAGHSICILPRISFSPLLCKRMTHAKKKDGRIKTNYLSSWRFCVVKRSKSDCATVSPTKSRTRNGPLAGDARKKTNIAEESITVMRLAFLLLKKNQWVFRTRDKCFRYFGKHKELFYRHGDCALLESWSCAITLEWDGRAILIGRRTGLRTVQQD